MLLNFNQHNRVKDYYEIKFGKMTRWHDRKVTHLQLLDDKSIKVV